MHGMNNDEEICQERPLSGHAVPGNWKPITYPINKNWRVLRDCFLTLDAFWLDNNAAWGENNFYFWQMQKKKKKKKNLYIHIQFTARCIYMYIVLFCTKK